VTIAEAIRLDIFIDNSPFKLWTIRNPMLLNSYFACDDFATVPS